MNIKFSKMTVLIAATFLLMLSACSQNDEQHTAEYEMEDVSHSESTTEQADFGAVEEAEVTDDSGSGEDGERRNNTDSDIQEYEDTERMVIYNGHLSIEVNEYDQTQEMIQEKVNQLGGYVVESSIYQGGSNENRTGNITVRVPSEHFFSFIDGIESNSVEIMEKSTHGNDVTEEYVDLESRLRSQETVEERLLSFLDEAENTEDLLKISNDLANTQEEIERIKGRMSYLENHVDYSTISISIHERAVNIASVPDRDSLNTFERAKSLFMDTINVLINFFSAIIVFLIGLSPVLVPFILISGGIYIYFNRRMVKKSKEE